VAVSGKTFVIKVRRMDHRNVGAKENRGGPGRGRERGGERFWPKETRACPERMKEMRGGGNQQ